MWASPAAHADGARVLITMPALCSACCTASRAVRNQSPEARNTRGVGQHHLGGMLMSHAHGGTQQLQVSGGANQAADTRVELDSTALLGPFNLRCSHLFRLKESMEEARGIRRQKAQPSCAWHCSDTPCPSTSPCVLRVVVGDLRRTQTIFADWRQPRPGGSVCGEQSKGRGRSRGPGSVRECCASAGNSPGCPPPPI